MLSSRIIDIAESQVGVKETRPNGGKMIEAYQKATWLPVGPWPWCAAFVCWCIKNAMADKDYTFTRPATAGAWDFEKWCKSVDNSALLRKPHNGDIKAGDIVIYTFSHIGIAVSDVDKQGIVQTVEGNTNSDGAREGDGVYQKRRNISQIRSIIRFTV
jgi:hypothetical protein